MPRCSFGIKGLTETRKSLREVRPVRWRATRSSSGLVAGKRIQNKFVGRRGRRSDVSSILRDRIRIALPAIVQS